MKICPKCHEEVEDSFEICWNCNYSFPDDKILDMTPAEESDAVSYTHLRAHET